MDMLIKYLYENAFSRMRRSVTAKSIQTKIFTSTRWVGTVIFLKPYANWYTGFERVWGEIWPLPQTLALASIYYRAYA